jgi:hypothetical protein
MAYHFVFHYKMILEPFPWISMRLVPTMVQLIPRFQQIIF